MYQENYNRVFSVVLMWSISQPFVCGTLEEVVKYALQPNNGIEGFYELTNPKKVTKVSKKQLKEMLNSQGLVSLSDELFKIY